MSSHVVIGGVRDIEAECTDGLEGAANPVVLSTHVPLTRTMRGSSVPPICSHGSCIGEVRVSAKTRSRSVTAMTHGSIDDRPVEPGERVAVCRPCQADAACLGSILCTVEEEDGLIQNDGTEGKGKGSVLSQDGSLTALTKDCTGRSTRNHLQDLETESDCFRIS